MRTTEEIKMKSYFEDDVLELLNNGKYTSANDFLCEKIPTMERRMNKAVKNLAALLDEVKLSFPDATFYTASGGLCLMLGASHSQDGDPQQDLIALSYSEVISIGDGDF
jgi:Arc/MetJ-type ribon-helix-helix transcriptional regulator